MDTLEALHQRVADLEHNLAHILAHLNLPHRKAAPDPAPDDGSTPAEADAVVVTAAAVIATAS